MKRYTKIEHWLGADGFLEPVLEFPPGVITVYVAGAEGFSETTRPWMNEVLIPRLEEVGVIAISPWELTTEEEILGVQLLPLGREKVMFLDEMNDRIAERNWKALEVADICVASLDGIDVDSGTAGEACMFAFHHKLTRPVFGRRSDFRQTGEEGSAVNLMVRSAIKKSGGSIVTTLDEQIEEVRKYVAKLRAS